VALQKQTSIELEVRTTACPRCFC